VVSDAFYRCLLLVPYNVRVSYDVVNFFNLGVLAETSLVELSTGTNVSHRPCYKY
jgi:hypothetical protein